jgi:predicted phosphodiesterase
MRIAIIADIHGNSAALDAVLADIARVGADLTVNLGDCLSGPLDPAGTAKRLIEKDFPTVRGNHDRILVDRPSVEMPPWDRLAHPSLSQEALRWVGALPPTLRVEGLFLCHGTPSSDTENWLDLRTGQGMTMAPKAHVEAQAIGIEAEAFLCAHTHIPRAVRLSDGRLAVNPGSVGCPAYAVRRGAESYAMSMGAPDARYAVMERWAGAWRVEFRAIPYDWAPMAALAREACDADFAAALETGWVEL